MTSKVISTGGRPIPNPAYIGLDKKMRPLMEKFAELDRCRSEAAKAYEESYRLEREAKEAPAKVAAARAEALVQGNTAAALKDPGEDLRKEAAEAWELYEALQGPVTSRIRREIEGIVYDHPEWQELAENKAMEGAEREQELQSELNAIQRNREFSYRLLHWLRNPERGVKGLPVR